MPNSGKDLSNSKKNYNRFFRYYEVKNEYNFHLYHYLRQKLDAKIDEFKKRQQLSLHDQVIEIAKKKPVRALTHP